MPARIPRPCRKSGCAGKTTDRSGYCDDHQKTEGSWNQWQKAKGNTTQRGYGHDWQKIRQRVIERDNNLCQPCMAAGRLRNADAVDHIKAKAHGGTNAMSNLQAICNECHKGKTASERGRGGSNL